MFLYQFFRNVIFRWILTRIEVKSTYFNYKFTIRILSCECSPNILSFHVDNHVVQYWNLIYSCKK